MSLQAGQPVFDSEVLFPQTAEVINLQLPAALESRYSGYLRGSLFDPAPGRMNYEHRSHLHRTPLWPALPVAPPADDSRRRKGGPRLYAGCKLSRSFPLHGSATSRGFDIGTHLHHALGN